VGQIWLSGNSSSYGGLDSVVTVNHFPIKLVASLNDDVPTLSYWDSIPLCDTLTAAQKQSAIDAVGLQNQFQTFFRR
jgi:hypothetical protein